MHRPRKSYFAFRQAISCIFSSAYCIRILFAGDRQRINMSTFGGNSLTRISVKWRVRDRTDWAKTRESCGRRISPKSGDGSEFTRLGLSNASIFDVLSGLRRRHREQRHTENAQSLHAEGWLAEAESLYLELLRTQPNAVEGLEGLGVLLFQLGRIEEAVSMFMRGVATDPKSPRFHTKLGAAYRNLRRFDQARVSHPEGDRAGSYLAGALELGGPSAFDQGRYADAEMRIARRSAASKFAVAYKNLSSTLLALGAGPMRSRCYGKLSGRAG